MAQPLPANVTYDYAYFDGSIFHNAIPVRVNTAAGTVDFMICNPTVPMITAAAGVRHESSGDAHYWIENLSIPTS